MLVSALAAIFFDSLLNSVIAAGLVSLIAAALFYFLQATDVAMTEAAIGAGLTTAIFIITLKKTEGSEED
jgi:multicomponent Na+:H+ antiporter subunit A